MIRGEEKWMAITTDILRKLNINTYNLPQKSQQILSQTAKDQISLKIDKLDPIALSLQHSRLVASKFEDEYQILKLKQKNAELQMKIDRNRKFLDDLRKELQCSRESLVSRIPNPENIQEHSRQLKLKVVTYEDNYEKVRAKFNKLSVPLEVYPKALMDLTSTLAALRDEAATWRQRADDVALAMEAKKTFNKLRRA
ncbi:hypothetical protein evm_013197 [Chilo suppressalis]|nr:hypothetical protein evm_013197 [Chilo suppressalis]